MDTYLISPIPVIARKITRDTPVGEPGGTVTIFYEKNEYGQTIDSIKRKLQNVGFCDNGAVFNCVNTQRG